jgi:predicted dienelactone hydrolase
MPSIGSTFAARLLAAVHLVLWAAFSLPAAAQTMQAGWRQITVPGGAREPQATVVALYYPTSATARAVPMGPFTVTAAIGSAPAATVKGLIVLSHGTGGAELGHSSLAQALAQSGYLVAALRHPGDNWQDTSLRDGPGAGRYLERRPQQVSQLIDALLQDPLWKDRIASDSRGPRVGAVGHSAGGYTVLALAGGEPDMNRMFAHCDAQRQADPIFCGVGKLQLPAPAPAATATAAATSTAAAAPARTANATFEQTKAVLTDPRVRAVVALAPLGVPFIGASLARITVPTLIYEAEQDRYLVPRFHSGWIVQNLPATPQTQRLSVPSAWHFVFMDTPSMPLPSPDGDIGADPSGFKRAAFLEQLGRALPAFFDQAW